MCSPSWTLLPPPSPYHPSGSSQCTSPKHPVSCIEPGLVSSICPWHPCFFLILFQIHISLFRLPIWSCTVSSFSIRILSILIIVVLNSLIIPTSLLPCLSVSTSLCFLSFDMPCNCLLIAGHALALIEKCNCGKKPLVNVGMRYEGRASALQSIRCQSFSKPMPL